MPDKVLSSRRTGIPAFVAAIAVCAAATLVVAGSVEGYDGGDRCEKTANGCRAINGGCAAPLKCRKGNVNQDTGVFECRCQDTEVSQS